MRSASTCPEARPRQRALPPLIRWRVPPWTPHPEPTEVRHEKGARRVVLMWDDGHESVFPIDYLRSWCPCAGCQGHEPVARYLGLSGQELTHLEGVGNYA